MLNVAAERLRAQLLGDVAPMVALTPFDERSAEVEEAA
jgi:hypothetical protein